MRAQRAAADSPAHLGSTVVQELICSLADAGVRRVFGIPGGPAGPFFDALQDEPRLRLVVPRHETAGVHMACGYHQATGEVVCCATTAGPGLTNAFTGLATAREECVPLILIAGDVPLKDHGRASLQEVGPYGLDARAAFRGCCKSVVEVVHPNAVRWAVEKAFADATEGRPGPVVIILPLDLAPQQTPWSEPSLDSKSTLPLGPHDWFAELAQQLASASHPLLVLGSGLRASRTARYALKLAEVLQCPWVTTPHAKGLVPEDHPLALGVYGMGMSQWALEYVRKGPDVVMVLGSELNDVSTRGYQPLAGPGGRVIQVDIDRGVFGRGHPVNRAVHADLKTFLPALLRAAEGATCRRRLWVRSGSRVQIPEATTDPREPLRPAFVIQQLVEQAPRGTRFVSDIGEHMMFALHYLEVHTPDQFFLPLGSGAMGTGLAMAIGLQAGLPGRTVVCITGDGCMEMHGLELVTAVAEEIPVVLAVFNDARLGMVRFGLQKILGRSPDYGTHPVDFAALAQSVGAEGRRVTHASDLDAALFRGRRPGAPLVLDIRIDPNEFAPANHRVDQIAATQREPPTVSR